MASVADAWRCLFGTCLTCPCCPCKRDGDSWQRTDDVSRIAGWCNNLAGLAMGVCVAFRNVRRVSCCHHCHEALPFSGNNTLPFPKRWWYPSTTLLMYLLLLFPFSRLNPLPSPKRFSSSSAGRNSAARVTCAEPFFFPVVRFGFAINGWKSWAHYFRTRKVVMGHQEQTVSLLW